MMTRRRIPVGPERLPLIAALGMEIGEGAVASIRKTIKQYQRDSSLQSIIMTNAEDRDRIFNHLFSRALREVRETTSP
jgi:hypothetical protein